MNTHGESSRPGKGSRSESVLQVVRSEFDRLGEQPVCLPAAAMAGLPEPPGSWRGLREFLLDPALPMVAVDAVWVALVNESRTCGGDMTIVCAGTALPMLINVAARLSRPWRGDHRDIDAAVLAGFLGELARIDLGRRHVLHRLRWAAYRGGLSWIEKERDAPTPHEDIGESTPARPALSSTPGHPELVMAEAVAEGVITVFAAELIAATRLQRCSLTGVAAARADSYARLHQIRYRAERKLVAWLRARAAESSDSDISADGPHALRVVSDPSGARSVGTVSNLIRNRGVPECGRASDAPAPPTFQERRCA
ncbi:hypothetical protein ACFWUP_21925 [Nocardia sp. NPDC058658]|uniref:hypothetical protein n=1 Tax=Nocardia sp. NPDC058658 TaxID=3346580 RepID=UPI00365ACAFD